MLRNKLYTLPKEKETIAFRKISLWGYGTHKTREAACFVKTGIMAEGILDWPYALKR